ncbi:MAG TPA: hypothetical protein VIB48_01410 [Acidimicrobiia bacterium]|jgi:hypothetical protein
MQDARDLIDVARPTVPADDREALRVTQTVGRLVDRFGDMVAPEFLEARVRALYATFDRAQVREFVPILVEREVMRELAALRRRP